MTTRNAQNADKRPLSPTQHLVWSLLKQHSRCRRDFAGFDVWEVANRISEIEDRLGYASVSLTEQAVVERRKTVTRRLGWKFLKPGDHLTLCRMTRIEWRYL